MEIGTTRLYIKRVQPSVTPTIVRNKNTLGRDTYKCPSLLRVGGGKLVLVPRGPISVGTSKKGSIDTTKQRGSNLGESGYELG